MIACRTSVVFGEVGRDAFLAVYFRAVRTHLGLFVRVAAEQTE